MLDRRKVTMRSITAAPNGGVYEHTAEDFVAVEHLDAYVADARTRWQAVTVGETTEHGPGGAEGAYAAPLHLL